MYEYNGWESMNIMNVIKKFDGAKLAQSVIKKLGGPKLTHNAGVKI